MSRTSTTSTSDRPAGPGADLRPGLRRPRHSLIDKMTQRICFQLHVRPDLLEEYRERHQHVWPDMLDALRAAGWRNYSLFLADDGTLTGYVECDDFPAALAAMAATDVNTRWQAD